MQGRTQSEFYSNPYVHVSYLWSSNIGYYCIIDLVEVGSTCFFLQAREENLVMPSGVSADGDNYEGATVIEPEKG